MMRFSASALISAGSSTTEPRAMLIRMPSGPSASSTSALIMFAVPVAAIGAFGGLALTHQSLNLYSMIGVVMLVVYAALIYAAYDRLAATPTGLIPQLDRGCKSSHDRRPESTEQGYSHADHRDPHFEAEGLGN